MLGSRSVGWRGCAIAVGILLASVATAADPKVEALLAKMREVYGSIKTAHFHTVSDEHEFDAPGRTESGIREVFIETYYKSPRMVRATIQGDGFRKPRIVIAKGDEIRSTTGRTRLRTLPYTLENLTFDMRGNLESLCFWDWDRQLSTASGKNMEHSTLRLIENVVWHAKKWTVLEETAGNSIYSYYIDPNTYMMWRTYIRSITDHREIQDARITNMVINQPVDDSKFD